MVQPAEGGAFRPGRRLAAESLPGITGWSINSMLSINDCNWPSDLQSVT